MDYNLQLYNIILQNIACVQLGLPEVISNDTILFAKNLIRSLRFAGITPSQRAIICGKLNTILNKKLQQSYTQGLFANYFNLNP